MNIDWLESLGPFTGKGEFDLGLMRGFCSYLGNPQADVPFFHVAGTNGKGSTSSAIAALLGHEGFRVGLNSSPHIESMRERFLIDGEMISNEQLAIHSHRLREASNELGQEPTFHEGATLIAFEAFKNLDRAVYEVGLGGRLDASNVLANPLVAVITSIALDHQAILGSSIKEIAYEKAGIVKANRPVVVGKVSDEAFEVISNKAKATDSRIYRYGYDFEVGYQGNVYRYKDDDFDFEFISPLKGLVQASNLGCALKAVSLTGIDISKASKGLESLNWPGRLETIEYGNKNFLLDAAHNAQGVNSLIEELDYREMKKALFIFGVLNRPDWSELVALLSRLPEGFEFSLLTPPGDRALSCRVLKEEFSKYNFKVNEFDYDYSGVIEYAKNHELKDVVIAGSVYLLGELRPLLGSPIKRVWKREKS